MMGEKTAKADDSSHTANDFADFFADKVEACLPVNINYAILGQSHTWRHT